MAIIETIIQLYAALLVVITVHELGHFPEKIRFKFGILPYAAAIRAKYRLGGLMANIIMFVGIYLWQPENIFLQYVGMISWIHFMLYAVFGSIIPEPDESQVNVNTYVFDDVPNKYAAIFIGLAIASFLLLKDMYLTLLLGLL